MRLNAKKWQDIPGRLKNITEALSNFAELKTATQEKISPREHTHNVCLKSISQMRGRKT